MAFNLYDYSNTHIFHRNALMNAVTRVNAAHRIKEDVMIIVSTRNMVRAFLKVLFTGQRSVVNIVGFGRLYSDYGIAGRIIFNTLIRLYSQFSALAFIVEHDVDRRLLEKLSARPVFTTHGSGLDIEGFKKIRNQRGKTLKIGYLSRFHKSKGSHEVLKASKQLPEDRELVIAGWDIVGENFSNAFKLVAEQKPNISFLGRLKTRSEVSDFFNSIDLFLSPSIREGGNISLQEGIWHGVPFITTDSPGCKVLAEIFDCPGVPMEKFSQTILHDDLKDISPDTSGWDEKLKPFLMGAVEEEYFNILSEVSENISQGASAE